MSARTEAKLTFAFSADLRPAPSSCSLPANISLYSLLKNISPSKEFQGFLTFYFIYSFLLYFFNHVEDVVHCLQAFVVVVGTSPNDLTAVPLRVPCLVSSRWFRNLSLSGVWTQCVSAGFLCISLVLCGALGSAT